MDTTPLKAESRVPQGKGAARKTRAAGKVPAVIYRGGETPVAITIDSHELTHIFQKSGNPNLVLDIAVGEDHHMAIVKDSQKHPISRNLLHVDFYKVDPELEVVVEVPVKPLGTAAGFQLGGMLITNRYTVTIRCRPADIPALLEVDITDMQIGDVVCVSEITVPEGCTAVFKHDYNLLSLVGRRVALEEDALEDAEGEEGAEVEASAESEEG